MNDDWRLRVDLHEEGLAHELTSRLEAFDLAHNLRTSFGDRVIVSRDGPEVFCYTDSREQAEAAESALRGLADDHGWRLDVSLERWHPTAERWEEPDAPLPQTLSETTVERSELLERERLESAQQGYPEFEVRVRCPSEAGAVELAAQLRAEGVQVLQRREFLLIGAADEASAAGLAARVRDQAPAGSDVAAEGSVAEVVAEAPFATPFSPFSVFGGLAG
jgi:hypothetical protein